MRTPDSFAPANDRKRMADVDRDAGALDQCDEASDGETVRTPIWPRALVPAAPAISFPSSRKVTPCHHLPRIKTFRSNN